MRHLKTKDLKDMAKMCASAAFLLAVAALLAPQAALADTWSSPGTYTWAAVPGVYSVTATIVGGGGGAAGGAWSQGNCAGDAGVPGAGGAGGYVLNQSIGTTPGQSYTVVVGAGGTGGPRTCGYSSNNGTAGQTSSFGVVAATGGGAGVWYSGGAGGSPQVSACITHSGGSGGGSSYSICPYNGTSGAWYCSVTTTAGTNSSAYGAGGRSNCAWTGNGGQSGYVSLTANDSCPTYAWQPWGNGIYAIEPYATRKVYTPSLSATGYCVTNNSGNYVVIGGGGGDPAGQLTTFRTYAANVGATTF
jgi:hypothetical protein